MKKSLFVIISLILVLACSMSVFAAGESAFGKVYVTADTKLHDEGGTNNPIAYMEAYGVGYSSKGDQVIFEDVDFGANGANKMYINFSYANKEVNTNIAVYIDNKSDTPACTYNIGYTGGWESKFAKEFSTDIEVPAGKHDIIVEFTDETGSFTYIRFDETPAKPTPTTAAVTADATAITVVAAAASLAIAAVAKKRAK